MKQEQISPHALNTAKDMHDAAVTAFRKHYPRWYVTERMNKPTAFASIPENDYEGRLFWNSLRVFFIRAVINVNKIPGIIVKDKKIDNYVGTEVRILFLDSGGKQQILRMFKAENADYFKCDILPFADFAARAPLVDETGIRSPAANRIRVEEAAMNTSVGILFYKAGTVSIRFKSKNEGIVCVYDLETNKLFIDPKQLQIRDRILEMFMQAMSEAAFIGRRYGFLQLEAELRANEPTLHTSLVVIDSSSMSKS